MDDKEVHRLASLVTSDFEMGDDDIDYQLTHQQLIKVCKILLHKVNYNKKFTTFQRED